MQSIASDAIMIFLFFRQTFRGTPYSYLIISLAITDTLRLWIELPRQWLKYLYGFDLRTMYIVTCKLQYYFETVMICTGAWILVIITLFRAVSIWKPHKAKLICTSRKAIALVVSSFIIHIICLLYIPLKFYSWMVVERRGVLVSTCRKNENLSYNEHNAMRWYIVIASSFLPFLCLILGNVYIIAKVTRAKFKRQQASTQISINRRPKRDHSMTVTLILISLLFLITTSPFMILKLFEFGGAFLGKRDRIFISKYRIWRSAALLFNYVNNVANIFCYWISGTLFRKELKALLCNKCSLSREMGTSSSGQVTGSTRDVTE